MREGDVSVDGLEGELQFDYESLNCEDMEFEPQTYFSLSELLASDDDGQVDGNNVTEDGSGSWENTSCSITHDGYSVELILLKKIKWNTTRGCQRITSEAQGFQQS